MLFVTRENLDGATIYIFFYVYVFSIYHFFQVTRQTFFNVNILFTFLTAFLDDLTDIFLTCKHACFYFLPHFCFMTDSFAV